MKFNIWYRKLWYWRHNLVPHCIDFNLVPHCIDFMHTECNVGEILGGTSLNTGKMKDGLND